MPTFGEVLSWDGTSLRAAGEALATAAKTYEEVYLDLTEVDAEGLEGETAEAEARARRVLADDAVDIQTALEGCGSDLTSAGDSVDSTRQVAEDIKTRARGDEFSVTDAGEVVDEQPDMSRQPGRSRPVDRQVKERSYKAEVTTLVEQAGDVVAYLEGVYAELAGLSSRAKGPSVEVVGYGAHQPPASWGVEEVNDWWTSLSPAEQQHIIETHPSWIGNLDGVPMEARDQANRKWLAVMVTEVDEEVENYDGPTETTRWVTTPSGGYTVTEDVSEWAALLERQRALHALKDQLDSVGGGDQHKLLVLDDTGEHFRAAIGTGDIDSADHVVVNTPGMTSTVASTLAGAGSERWGSGVEGTDAMVQEAQRQLSRDGRHESVAGVTWLGYDAPQYLDEATSRSAAEQAAPDLASFYEGVQATHQGDPHLVAAGHSYGSTTTGLAVQASSAPDEMMVYGSPGTGSLDASDMGLLPRDQMFSVTTEDDLIQQGAAHGGNPDRAPDYTHLETGAHANPDYDAGDPESGSKNLQGSSGHSQYTDRGDDTPRHTPSTSLYNMGSVLAGNDRAIPEGGLRPGREQEQGCV